MKLLAVGGGSGGHVTPVLAVINSLAARDASLEVRFVCDKAFEAQSRGLMKQASVPVKVSVVAAGKFRRYHHLTFWQHFAVRGLVLHNIFDGFKIGLGFIQSFGILLFHRPDVVFAKGGYVCLPMGVAARLLRVPLVIHDSDSRPGLTSRLLAPYAAVIATGYPLENYSYNPKKSFYVGVPVGSDFTKIDSTRQAELKAALGFPLDRKLVVVTGGGLGSRVINDAAIMAAKNLQSDAIDVHNVTGKKNYQAAVAAGSDIVNYKAVDFVYQGMADLLGAADVVVSRASATFLQELAALGKAAVVIPARQLNDQQKNAELYRRAEAAIVLTDDDITSTTQLPDALRRLCNDSAENSRYAAALYAFARPDAADKLAELIESAAKKSSHSATITDR